MVDSNVIYRFNIKQYTLTKKGGQFRPAVCCTNSNLSG